MPDRDSLIPPIGSIPQAERMFRVNWVANLRRSPSGVPLLKPDFVAKQGRKVRIVDVRGAGELVGAVGYIPGSDWVPVDRVASLSDRTHSDDPIIFVAEGEERSDAAAVALERAGHRFVASMMGGLIAWRDDGYSTTRDASILDRRDVVREIAEGPTDPPEAVSAEDIEQHVGDPLSVKWIKLSALLVRGLVSCVDGRDDSGVVGSPGGDAGELLVGLRALERIVHRELRDDEIAILLARRNDVFGRFYMHTDIHANNHLVSDLRADRRFDVALQTVKEPLEWRRFMESPPDDLRAPLLEYAVSLANVGCGHLRLELANPDAFGTREALVLGVLRSFHESRWSGHPDLDLVPLAGGHVERAVINVRIAGPLLPFSRIPLVSPAVGGAQVFVHHPRITSYLRRQLASFLALQTDIGGSEIDPTELHEEMVRIGAMQLGCTLGALARGLPIYDVTFHGESRVVVTPAGVVQG